MSAAALSVRGVNKSYGKGKVLNDITFDAKEGEVFGIIGPNGAGKTTLIKILCGIEAADKGSVDIMGAPVFETSSKTNIGYLPETSSLYEDMSVNDYLLFFSEIYGIKKETALERITSLLKDVDIYDKRNDYINSLSNGMKRKVAIIRALIHQPKILIFDEPTANLDIMTSGFIRKFMGKLAVEGKTVIFATHNPYEAESLCDRIAIIKSGTLIRLGNLRDIIKRKTIIEYDSDGVKNKIEVVSRDIENLGSTLVSIKGKILDITESDLSEEFERAMDIKDGTGSN